MPPAEFGVFGVRYGGLGRACHQLAEAFQSALLVGPQEDRQAFHGAGCGDIEEVGCLFGLFFFYRCRRLCDGRGSGYRAGGEKRDLILVQAERAAVFGMRDLGRPVEPSFQKRKTWGNSSPLVPWIVASFTRSACSPSGTVMRCDMVSR